MSDTIKGAIIIAVAIIIAGFLIGGIYVAPSVGPAHEYHLNKFTGDVSYNPK
jgi:hypothetical protein